MISDGARITEVACKKITHASFHIIARAERIFSFDETYVTPAFGELEVERRILGGFDSYLIENLAGKKRVVCRIQ